MSLLYRSFELDRKAVDVKAREARLSFSSEAPVDRWGEAEILLHGKKNAQLKRLTTVGALLYGHNTYAINSVLGPIKSAEIGDDRRGHAVVGFDEDEAGETALGKAASGSLRGVSFGYRIRQARRLSAKETWKDPDSGREFSGPSIIGTLWEAAEISLTPIPADITVGIGRDALYEGVQIAQTIKPEVKRMERDEIIKLVREILQQDREATVEQVAAMLTERARPRLAVTVEEAQALRARAGAISSELLAEVDGWIWQQKDNAEIMHLMLEWRENAEGPDADNPGGGPGKSGTGHEGGRNAQGGGQVMALDQVEDEDFWRSLSTPAMFSQ